MKILHSLPDEIFLGNVTLVLCVKDYRKAKFACVIGRIRHRTVLVLSKGLRGKTDLHGEKYQPNKYLFVDKNKLESIQ